MGCIWSQVPPETAAVAVVMAAGGFPSLASASGGGRGICATECGGDGKNRFLPDLGA